ncbi:hypothetical protein [Clostridium senegalense]|nr:hypothetical protein [Clostridium senegalense]
MIAYLVDVEILRKLTMDKGQLTMMEETGLPVSFEFKVVKSEFRI